MWLEFAQYILLGAGILFIPGYPIARLLVKRRFDAFVCAPLVTMAGYTLTGFIYSKLGIPTSWESIVIPLFVIALACFAMNVYADRKKSSSLIALIKLKITRRSEYNFSCSWLFLILYLLIGAIAVALHYVACFNGTDSFVMDYDNTFHIGIIRTFLDTHSWSPVDISVYEGLNNSPEDGSTGFYPAAWHIFTTIIVDMTDCSIPVAVNASTTLFLFAVFSSGMLFLMLMLFPENKSAVFAGSICIFSFAAFPWRALMVPLTSQIASYCMMPAILGLFIRITNLKAFRDAIKTSLLFAIGLVAIVLTQTNIIFTSMVFLLPYCIHKLWILPVFFGKKLSYPKRILLISLFIVAFVLVWMLFYSAPFMQSIVNYTWKAFLSTPQAIINILFLSFRDSNAQVVLAIFVIIGFIVAASNSKTRWLTISYFLFCLMFFIGTTTEGEFKHILDGFWYTDRTRLAANTAICAMPLAALGIGWLSQYVINRIKHHSSNNNKCIWLSTNALICFVVSVCVFYPNFSLYGIGDIETAFGKSDAWMQDTFSKKTESVFGNEERKFVEKAKELIPEGALVINQPTDGSVFAYGANDLNTYYRSLYPGDSNAGKVIREQLSDIASNPHVAALVNDLNAQYVIQLDAGNNTRPYVHKHYNPANWTGIDSITEDTPGFELVLSEGDMRLYKIVASNDESE